ncbi:MICOS complex subunit MIC60 [Falsiroseomonas tokyonensis]|uniref:Uncharacterized protein n=1 Tax=Falsiroseomonas tokyonensis TaxID=430521 RepID=A0ABV7BQZ0_9PROT|nr:hypothetical protein [Falsiroseomonas tokyonensis]MBU8536966.1 hypothetical protein [Falsiroseomonas tokyonensis]
MPIQLLHARRLSASILPSGRGDAAPAEARPSGIILAPLAGVVCGAALAAGALLLWPGALASAGASSPAVVLAVEDRAAALETLLRQANAQLAAHAARAEAAAQQAEAAAQRMAALEQRGPTADRFLAAALLLQSSIATPRPWLREYQAMAALAPPGALPPPLAEVLASHAARGLPTEAELRERFAALAPQLLARAPREATLVDQAGSTARGMLAAIGLAAQPQPGAQATALAGIAEHLKRGNLPAALADAGALDASLQPLVAGWLAQARARVAVEQAVQETLLRALSPPPSPALAAMRRPS